MEQTLAPDAAAPRTGSEIELMDLLGYVYLQNNRPDKAAVLLAARGLLLKDLQAVRRIQVRIDRAEDGNFGDCEPVGEGVSEMRIHYGPGYRVYFVQRGLELVILLAGGDKSTQPKDIRFALDMARQL